MSMCRHVLRTELCATWSSRLLELSLQLKLLRFFPFRFEFQRLDVLFHLHQLEFCCGLCFRSSSRQVWGRSHIEQIPVHLFDFVLQAIEAGGSFFSSGCGSPALAFATFRHVPIVVFAADLVVLVVLTSAVGAWAHVRVPLVLRDPQLVLSSTFTVTVFTLFGRAGCRGAPPFRFLVSFLVSVSHPLQGSLASLVLVFELSQGVLLGGLQVRTVVQNVLFRAV